MNEAPFPEPTQEQIEQIEIMYGTIPEPPLCSLVTATIEFTN